MLNIEKRNINMAEEKHQNQFDEVTHDDMQVMKTLLQTVKGLSPISTAPVLIGIESDELQYDQ